MNNPVLRHRRNPFENSRMLKGREAKMPDHAALRYPQDARNLRLKETTIGWIRSLPRPVRPRALAKLFPRIANILADDWSRPAAFETRLRNYMLDERGNRQGFPFEVVVELSQLQNHFDRIHRHGHPDAWSLQPPRD